MSQDTFDRDRSPEELSLDELIASAKADLNEAPPKFEAQIPSEYADLADEIIGSDDETRELQAVRSGISGINSNIRETSACLPQQDWGA